MLWLHLSAIVVWIGGMLAVSFVAAPVIRASLPSEEAQGVIGRIVRRFLRLSRELVLIVLLSGTFIVLNIGYISQFAYTDRFLWIVGAKFALFLALAANQMWYSLKLVPAGRHSAATASSVLTVLLAVVVVYLAVALRGG